LRKLFTDFVSREITLVTKIMNSGIRQKEFSISSPGKTAETLVHTIQGLRLRFLRNAPLDLEDYRKLKPELLLLARVFVRGLQCQ